MNGIDKLAGEQLPPAVRPGARAARRPRCGSPTSTGPASACSRDLGLPAVFVRRALQGGPSPSTARASSCATACTSTTSSTASLVRGRTAPTRRGRGLQPGPPRAHSLRQIADADRAPPRRSGRGESRCRGRPRAGPHRHRQLPRRLRQGQADPRLGARRSASPTAWRPPWPSTGSTRGTCRRPEPAAAATLARLQRRRGRVAALRPGPAGPGARGLRARVRGVHAGAPHAVARRARARRPPARAGGRWASGPGDEVIVPAFTAVPTAAAVCAVGAVPVPVDVDPATAALDPDAAAAAVTSRTRGRRARPPLRPARARCPTWACPSSRTPRRPTARSPAARRGGGLAYSFYPTKNLGGIGDGGAVVTDDADLADAVRRLRVHGMAEQYVHVDVAHELPHVRARGGVAAARAARARRRQRAGAPNRRALPPGRARRWSGTPTTRATSATCAWCAVPERDAVPRRGWRRAAWPRAVHYPLAITQQPAYRHLTREAVPRGRGVGGRVRDAALLPRAHRRRGRPRCARARRRG